MAECFKPCSVENCNGNSSNKVGGALGLCRPHYKKQRKYGDPLYKFDRKDSAVMQWMKKNSVFTGEECLIWPFAKNKQGYGVLHAVNSSRLAHRIMCEIKNGKPESEKLDAAHSCGNGHLGCVNPMHLRWDSRSGNCSDKMAHGTDNRGEKSPVSKLTNFDVSKIRRLRGSIPQRELAIRFGVDQSNICKIQKNVSWSYKD